MYTDHNKLAKSKSVKPKTFTLYKNKNTVQTQRNKGNSNREYVQHLTLYKNKNTVQTQRNNNQNKNKRNSNREYVQHKRDSNREYVHYV